MACGGKWILLSHRVAREGRVHQNDAGVHAKLANPGGIVRRDLAVGKQQAQDLVSGGIDFVEVEAPALSSPGSQQTDARAGFENKVIAVDFCKTRGQPRERNWRRKVLVSDLFLAAHGLGRKLRGELFQAFDGLAEL